MHGPSPFAHPDDPAHELGHRTADAAESAAVPYLALRAIVNAIPLDVQRSNFVDYGSDLGRALVAARRAGFARVVGVEPSASLVAAGRARMRGYAGWEIVHSDAANFRVPDDATAFFFGNPFAGVRLARVLLQIQRSIERRPRRHVILGYYEVDRMAATARRADVAMRRVLQGYYKPDDKSWAGWALDNPARPRL